MNNTDPRYTPFNLVTDMLATPAFVRSFDPAVAAKIGASVAQTGKLHFTGEGSSRLFPTKHAIKVIHQRGTALQVHTEAGKQSQSYRLQDWSVIGLSNSGRTAEVIQLFKSLKEAGHTNLSSITAFANSTLESFANQGIVLGCGAEGAVAATKSVIEQALCCQAAVEAATGQNNLKGRLNQVADAMQAALTAPIAKDITDALVNAPVISWAGPNDGVAEELTLKTNEITRKRSDYFEGTYAAHGVEEVMTDKDVVIWVDPIADQEEKFEKVLVHGAGVKVIAISTRPTRFPTILVQDCGDLTGFAYMAAGWNLLVEAGTALSINVDKPQRARKVGNEFVGG